MYKHLIIALKLPL